MPATTDVDPAAARFERIRSETVGRVTAYARSRVPPDEAADVVAETYLIAWRRRDDIPDRALPWLLVVARNLISGHRRTATRNAVLIAEIERLHHLTTTAGPDIADQVTERLAVLAAVDALSPADREVVALAFWDGLTAREAGGVLGCSAATFAVRLHRARARLARAMTAQDADPPSGGSRARPRARTTRPSEETP